MAPKRKRDSKPSTSPAGSTRSASVKATRSATRSGAASLKPPVDNPEPRMAKKAKNDDVDDDSKVIMIEYCKKSGELFETKANGIKNGLEKDLTGKGVKVVTRAKKGCFVIREKNGDVFVNFVDLKKPFEAIEEMDVQKVVADIVDKVN